MPINEGGPRIQPSKNPEDPYGGIEKNGPSGIEMIPDGERKFAQTVTSLLALKSIPASGIAIKEKPPVPLSCRLVFTYKEPKRHGVGPTVVVPSVNIFEGSYDNLKAVLEDIGFNEITDSSSYRRFPSRPTPGVMDVLITPGEFKQIGSYPSIENGSIRIPPSEFSGEEFMWDERLYAARFLVLHNLEGLRGKQFTIVEFNSDLVRYLIENNLEGILSYLQRGDLPVKHKTPSDRRIENF